MLDIQFIRDNRDRVQEAARLKGIEISVDTLLDLDVSRRDLLKQVETRRHHRNTLSRNIATQSGDAREASKEAVRRINTELAELETRLNEATEAYNDVMRQVPNVVSPDTPIGASDADNVEIRRVGTPTTFDFEPLDHVQLMQHHHMLDIERGVKVGGSRAYYLKGWGLRLHRAMQQLAVDMLLDRGFNVMDVPMLVREEALENTGFFPGGREQTYELPRDGQWLVGTSEVPLVSYYANEVVDVSQPIRMAAVSACFRREAGSAGRDTRGLYRVHQFAKVEQVVLCENDVDVSQTLFDELTQNAEDLLGMLELPYRVVAVCTGDLSQKNYKQVDIESWMPSRDAFGETHSSSMLLDFQARRSNIRYRDQDGRLQFCHTLNNTAVASPRILIPLVEVHQQADGSIRIPAALQPYLGGSGAIQ